MLKWASMVAVVWLIAGIWGFSGVAAGAAGSAKLLFVVSLVICQMLLGLAVLGAGALRK